MIGLSTSDAITSATRINREALRHLVDIEIAHADAADAEEAREDPDDDVDSQASLSSDGSNDFQVLCDEDSYDSLEAYLQARHQH